MLAKLAAARPHDLEFVEGALREGLVTAEELGRGVPLMPASVRERVKELLAGLDAKIARSITPTE